ncbi:MAG: hypothetical protein IPF46_07020 [Saprospiraceae bacterium]|nr:hypothetical protein [Candidatus Vicinibacter affinis]
MKIISIQALRGPNVHSFNPYKLIHLRLDLSEENLLNADDLDLMLKNLPLIPEEEMALIIENQISEPTPQLDLLAKTAGRLALELQNKSGLHVHFLKILKTIYPGTYGVIFEYKEEEAGKAAAQASFDILQSLLNGQQLDLEAYIEKIENIKLANAISPGIKMILDAAASRGIPAQRLFGNEYFLLGYGKFQKTLYKSLNSHTNAVASRMASDRDSMMELLYEASIPFTRKAIASRELFIGFRVLILNHEFAKVIISDGTSTQQTPNESTVFRLERISHILNIPDLEIWMHGENLNDPNLQVADVNITPDLEFFAQGSAAQSQEIAGLYLNGLFPPGTPFRIPIISVTGTNGKTTTTRLIAHIIEQTGTRTGFTTSDGVYVNGVLVEKGDNTGPGSAGMVLRDSSVAYAVLETARGGLLRAGLAFSQCDIAVITNVTADHLGLSDVHTLDELAKVKGLVVDAVKPGGWAVLNAENEYTYHIGQQSKNEVAYFSLDKNNPALTEHLGKGKTAAYVEDGLIKIMKNTEAVSIIHVEDIPLTFGGRVGFMVANALAASLACYVAGFTKDQIASGLKTFHASAEQTPGRLNIFDFPDFKVMVDFAHNPEGFSGIRDFLKTINSPYHIGIITGTGDRPDDSIIKLGYLSAEMFDHIIIHQAKFHRGRTPQAIVDLLVEGIKSCNPNCSFEYIPDEVEPLQYAMSKVKKDAFITALSDVLNNPIELIRSYQNSYKK